MPDGGDCPLCRAQEITAPNTSRHRMRDCAMPALLYRCVLQKWRTLCPEDVWTDSLTSAAAFREITPGVGLPNDRTLQRGIAIGLRPANQSASGETFALLRGLVTHEIEAQATAAAAVIREGLPPRAADLYHTVAGLVPERGACVSGCPVRRPASRGPC